MSKPDDVSAEAWEEAKSRTTDIERRVWGDDDFLAVCEAIARTIDAAIAKERERCAERLMTIAKSTPLGHESIQRGKSTYNWLSYAAELVRKGA